MVTEDLHAAERGEEVGKEILKERVFRPVSRLGNLGNGGLEGSEFGTEDLPTAGE